MRHEHPLHGLVRKFNRFARYPTILTLLSIAALCTWILIVWFPPVFAAITDGLRPFDLQPGIRFPDSGNRLTAEVIFTDLESWSPLAFDMYRLFIVVDMVLPITVFTGMLLLNFRWATRLRPEIISRAWILLLAPLVPMLIDLGENLGFLLVVNAWPEQAFVAAAQMAASLHGIKVMTVQGANLVLIIIGILAFAPGFSVFRK